MAAFIFGTFYAAMAAAGLVVEFLFAGVGIERHARNAKVVLAHVSFNYTTARSPRTRYGDCVSFTVELRSPRSRLAAEQRRGLERRARRLAWGGNAWHLIELGIALGAGIAAGSVALVGFGADSLIEAASGSVIVWLFTAGRGSSGAAERRAQRLISGSYFLLTAYILAESLRDLIAGHHPQTSWVGIGLAAFTAPTMPLLARAKRRVGHELSSAATVAEAEQNQICAYLSLALLAGLLLNALAGWWWADPGAALLIAAVAAREGRESWKGKSCDCC